MCMTKCFSTLQDKKATILTPIWSVSVTLRAFADKRISDNTSMDAIPIYPIRTNSFSRNLNSGKRYERDECV